MQIVIGVGISLRSQAFKRPSRCNQDVAPESEKKKTCAEGGARGSSSMEETQSTKRRDLTIV